MDRQWGGPEILQTRSCSGQVFEKKPWQETPRTEQKRNIGMEQGATAV